MSNTSLVLKFSVKNQMRMTSLAIITFTVILICVVGTILLFAALLISPEMDKAVPDMAVLENTMGTSLFCASFLTIGIYASVYTYQSLVREKARGNIQALLATSVSPMEMWLGKTLGTFLPGLAAAIVMTVIAFLILNLIYFADGTGFIITPWMVISNFIAVPLLYFTVTLFVHFIGFIGKPLTANIIGQIFLPVMANIMIQLAVRTSLDAGSWLFMAILLGFSAVIAAGIYFIRPKLTTEKVIMSLQG